MGEIFGVGWSSRSCISLKENGDLLLGVILKGRGRVGFLKRTKSTRSFNERKTGGRKGSIKKGHKTIRRAAF